MTKDQVDLYTKNGVFQAIVNGRPLQYRVKEKGTVWNDVEGVPLLDAETVLFRVKPVLNKPKVFRAGDVTSGQDVVIVYPNGTVSELIDIDECDDNDSVIVVSDERWGDEY